MGNDESKEGLPDDGDIDNPDHSFGGGNKTIIAPKDAGGDGDGKKAGAADAA